MKTLNEYIKESQQINEFFGLGNILKFIKRTIMPWTDEFLGFWFGTGPNAHGRNGVLGEIFLESVNESQDEVTLEGITFRYVPKDDVQAFFDANIQADEKPTLVDLPKVPVEVLKRCYVIDDKVKLMIMPGKKHAMLVIRTDRSAQNDIKNTVKTIVDHQDRITKMYN